MQDAKVLLVFLAPDEWGSEKMREVAEYYFSARPEIDVVQVYEHAGWFLAWNREGLCVGTANDAAILKPEAYEYIRTHRFITHNTVWRLI
jgi:hypothetical protein